MDLHLSYAAREAINALSGKMQAVENVAPSVNPEVEGILGPGKDVTDPGAKEKNIGTDRPFKDAVDRIKDIPGAEVKEFDTKLGKGVTIDLPDGTRVSARPRSEKTGEPTIEVTDPDGTTVKTRFPKQGNDLKKENDKDAKAKPSNQPSDRDSDKRLSDSDR